MNIQRKMEVLWSVLAKYNIIFFFVTYATIVTSNGQIHAQSLEKKKKKKKKKENNPSGLSSVSIVDFETVRTS